MISPTVLAVLGETLQFEPYKPQGADVRVPIVWRTPPSSCLSDRDLAARSYRTRHCRAGRKSRAIFFTVLLSGISSVLCWAGPPIPGEAHSGAIYTLTHLHPVAYFILFLIFLLSLANLAVRGFIPVEFHWLPNFFGFVGKFEKTILKTVNLQGFKGKKRDPAPARSGPVMRVRDPESSVVGVRKHSNRSRHTTGRSVPTPLDGINHPMPRFTRVAPPPVRKIATNRGQNTTANQFKPYPTAGLVSHEEEERHEAEPLAVSGSITDSEGRGLGSVIVYLTDEAGTRQGQSYRSRPGTGDYWVFANKPGKYILHAYKRGYLVQTPEPVKLTVESRKIDGFNLSMIAEECAVQGRVFNGAYGNPAADMEVRCVCKSSGRASSCRTDESGKFLLTGVPVHSECELEVWGANNAVLARSQFFETVPKGQIQRDIVISAEDGERGDESIESIVAWEQTGAGEPTKEDLHEPVTETRSHASHHNSL